MTEPRWYWNDPTHHYHRWKKNDGLGGQLLSLFSDMAHTASRTAGYQKTIRHLLAHTLCLGKHTVTQLLCTAGQQHNDWSAAYRLYSTQLQAPALFEPIIKGVDALLNEQQPLVLAVDDSMLSKTGRKIPGAGWHRDSLSPAFHTNLKYSMKFVQLSAAVHPLDHPECSRLIQVAFELIPKLPKLSLEPSSQERARYRANSPSVHALQLLKSVRHNLSPERPIYLAGDGNYTNTTLLRGIPEGGHVLRSLSRRYEPAISSRSLSFQNQRAPTGIR